MARILVIDDEESIRYTFESFLSDEGHAVSIAGNYKEAVRAVADTDFDLVISDIILGDKTGIDVLSTMRERELNCPVVIITGYPTVKTASDAVRLRAFEYLPKPVQKETLLAVTGKALAHKALTDEKERYRSQMESVFRSARDGIITFDHEFAVVRINDAARELWGLGPDVVGKPFEVLRELFTGDLHSFLREAIETGKTGEAERIELAPAKGGRLVVTVTASPLLDKQGAVSGAVLTIKEETPHRDKAEGDNQGCGQFHRIVGRCDKMKAVYSLIESLSGVRTTVLITGESGTGKELVAEALHCQGTRRDKPLIKVNCSALSEGLLESELFGHVRGAFTGAVQNKIGRFERADGGTLFLDEVGDLSLATQQRLLRVLQEKEFERVGDTRPIKVDVRLVTATNRDLVERVRRGEFREDLYYRLKVMEVSLPPLRDRKEDIPLLVNHFIEKFNQEHNRGIKAVSAEVMRLFASYQWPGNVRELEHTIEHAFILCRQGTITLDHLPVELRCVSGIGFSSADCKNTPDRGAILKALEETAWNKAKASRLLGISRQTIYRKILEHSIQDRIM